MKYIVAFEPCHIGNGCWDENDPHIHVEIQMLDYEIEGTVWDKPVYANSPIGTRQSIMTKACELALGWNMASDPPTNTCASSHIRRGLVCKDDATLWREFDEACNKEDAK